MMTLIPDLPEDTVGVRASGIVTTADYLDVLDPAIDAVLAGHDRVNLVYVIGPDVDHYTFKALVDDASLAKHPRHDWGRMAVVTDHGWMDAAIHTMLLFYPINLQRFSVAQEAQAIAWVAEGGEAA